MGSGPQSLLGEVEQAGLLFCLSVSLWDEALLRPRQLRPRRLRPLPHLRLRFVTQSPAPTVQVPPPAPSVELGALPASVEDWASYSCPEEVTAVFKQDKSDFMVNACSFHRPVSSPKDCGRGPLCSRCHVTASSAVQKSRKRRRRAPVAW